MRTIFQFILLLLTASLVSKAQTTYVPLWAKEAWLLDRMEIKAGTNNHLNLSMVKPYARKIYVGVADSVRLKLDAGQNDWKLTKIDQHNLDRFQANNSEFSTYTPEPSEKAWKSKRKPFLGFLWPVKGNAVEVNEKDFYMVVNPVINQQQSIETDFDNRVFVNAKGITARGIIAQKIGFHFYATDNQEQGPIQFRSFADSNKATPGAGFSKSFKQGRGRDYFDARGSISWAVNKHVDIQFGFDQHFIGNGYRSLFLGNAAPPNLFLKYNTRIWKLNYTNLFSETFPPEVTAPGDVLRPKQYSATHHLSVNVAPWLNVGVFENVIFSEADVLKVWYLHPVIFANSLLRKKDGNTNSFVGLDVKANLLKSVQVYGQWILQNGSNGESRQGGNHWTNRQGFQAGAKYIDAFGLKNLDLQAEINQVRPFTYSSPQNVGSWTNYRQSIAHPLGSNFREIVGIFRYQPTTKLYIWGRVNYWKQGLDSARFNFGSNPRVDNSRGNARGSRLRDDGYEMFSGAPNQTINMAITVSYEIKENLFIDLNNLYRVSKRSGISLLQNTNVLTIGVRWNMFRRDYDY